GSIEKLGEAGRAVGRRAGDGRQGGRIRRGGRTVGDPRDARAVRSRRARALRSGRGTRRARLMDYGSRIRDDLPVNLPYDGLVAEAYDCWLPPSRDYQDRDFYREAIARGAGPALELGCGNGRLLVGYRADGLAAQGAHSSYELP